MPSASSSSQAPSDSINAVEIFLLVRGYRELKTPEDRAAVQALVRALNQARAAA